MENDNIIWSVKKDAIANMIKEGKRSDGRKLDDFREIQIKEMTMDKAEGSCWLQLGKTQLIVGIKIDVGEPYPDNPDEGTIVTNCELTPIASPEFRVGPPGEEAIELARVVDRGIRESKMINLKKLCIKEGELAYTVLIDIHVLDYDGNLFDAATIAAVKALLATKLPKVEDNRIVRDKSGGKLPTEAKPVSCTFAKIDGINVIDPCLEEEKTMDSRITITTKENGNICAMQKEGTGSYTIDEIKELIQKSIKIGKEIRKLY